MLCNQSILFMHVCVCMCESLSRVQLLATPWTAAHQAPPPMGFSRQEYWSGLPFYIHNMGFPVTQMVKNLPAMKKTQVQSLGWEDPLETGMVNSNTLAWRIPWTEETDGLQSMGWQRVSHFHFHYH